MQVEVLEKYLPENTFPFLKNWFGGYNIHIKITKERSSKLGDYRKIAKNQFVITINHTLPPELFFFVFTHEMAHLLAFEKYGRRIAPHGKEWKHTFREMLLQTIEVYSENVKPLILEYAVSPKANFAASTGLKRYFYPDTLQNDEVFIENLIQNEVFIFRNEMYKMKNKRTKNYLCTKLFSGAEYTFRALVKVKRADEEVSNLDDELAEEIPKGDDFFVRDLQFGDLFIINNIRFRLQMLRRKNYLCKMEDSGKLYIFKPLVKVKKIS